MLNSDGRAPAAGSSLYDVIQKTRNWSFSASFREVLLHHRERKATRPAGAGPVGCGADLGSYWDLTVLSFCFFLYKLACSAVESL